MSLNVVIVDDSILVRERLVNMLSAIPTLKVVGEAGNSFQALSVVEKEKPHAVVIDIKMPGESGVDVVRKIKEKNPMVIAIILTNYPFSQYREKCFENGADYFFDKSEEYAKVAEVLEEKANNGALNKILENWQV